MTDYFLVEWNSLIFWARLNLDGVAIIDASRAVPVNCK